MASSRLNTSDVCGIYVITCTNSGKVYIGSSVNIRQRWNEHCSDLRRNCHANQYLQNAWNKYGEECFVFTVMESCSPENLITREQYYLDTRKPFGAQGFNLATNVQASGLGRVVSEETKAKIGAASKGRMVSQETRQRMSVSRSGIKRRPESIAKSVAAMTGRKQTPEHVEKRIAPIRGRTRSPEAIAKGASKIRGVAKSPEHRAKLSAANTGKKQSAETIARSAIGRTGLKQSAETKEKRAETFRLVYVVTDPTGMEMTIKGLNKFCRENGLDTSTLCAVAQGKRPHHKGWLCRRAYG